MWKLFFASFSILLQSGLLAQEVRLNSELEAALGKCILQFDNRLDLQEKAVSDLIRFLADEHVPDCKVKDWLQRGIGNASVLQYLQDRLREQQNNRADVERRLLLFFPNPNGKVREQIEQLSKQIAANEDSLTRIQEDVLPVIERNIEINRRDIGEAHAIIRLAQAEYRSEFISICERLSRNELDIRVMKLRLDSESSIRPALPSRDTQTRPPTSNSATIYPDAIVDNAKFLCAKARLVQQNYEYIAREVARGSIREVYYRGVLYRNCNGQYVLLLSRTQ